MDVLSDVLRVVRLTSAVFFTARFSSPWSIESPPADQLVRSLKLRAESIALFHVLVEGQCWITMEGQAPERRFAERRSGGGSLAYPIGETSHPSSGLFYR